jgi:long-subunit fatty acid transport protein
MPFFNIKLRMIKKIIIVFVLLLAFSGHSQESSSSPYSFYGIGDVRFKGTFENRNMAGMSVLGDSISLNLSNPAAHPKLRATTFSVGANNNINAIESNQGSSTASRTTIDYFALGLPMGKLAFTFGLMPFSSVGYKIRNTTEVDETLFLSNFSGSGGLNRVFLASGYQLTKNLSVGLEINHNFGLIETTNTEYISGIETGAQELSTSRLNGSSATLGFMYDTKISDKLSVFSSLTYTPETKLSLENERTLKTVISTPNFGDLEVDRINLPVENTTIKLPTKLTGGLAVGDKQKWILGTEITYQESSQLGNRFSDIDNVTFENSMRVSLGGFYIPKYNSFTSYLSRVTYRAGLRYENTGMIIQNQGINDYGMNFGLGLPLGGGLSKINIGFEYGQRGTLNQNLVRENYFNLSVGLTFIDKWFQKYKYE